MLLYFFAFRRFLGLSQQGSFSFNSGPWDVIHPGDEREGEARQAGNDSQGHCPCFFSLFLRQVIARVRLRFLLAFPISFANEVANGSNGRWAPTSLANWKAAQLLTAPLLAPLPAHRKTTSSEGAGVKREPHCLTDTAVSLFTPPGSLRLVQCSAVGADYFWLVPVI